MFTIIRLLRLGWAFSGNESLGMVTVTQENSVFYGFKHVPRMLRDQLNHALELKMMELDTRILKSARDILENGKRSMWVIGYLVLFFLLHVREVYAGRLLIWRDYYTELVWISLDLKMVRQYTNNLRPNFGFTHLAQRSLSTK